MSRTAFAIALSLAVTACTGQTRQGASFNGHPLAGGYAFQEYELPPGSGPHDVAPAPDGFVWYTAQQAGYLGKLDPATGKTRSIALGARSAPHGVIVGPDGAPWITDGGLNAIVRVDPKSEELSIYPLPPDRPAESLNTATFDFNGILWFTGQSGVFGRLDPKSRKMDVFDAPLGAGPYGMSTSPSGDVYYASLAHSYLGRIDVDTAEVTVIDPPTANQGARRVWPDSSGRVWISEWNVGQVGVYDPKTEDWIEWLLPASGPGSAYAVFVDDRDLVWLSNWRDNSLTLFDPSTEDFQVFELPSPRANVRQILGRPGEIWAAESGVNKLVVLRSNTP